LSDSNGYVYDPDGIKLDTVKQIKEVERKRISEYVNIILMQNIQKDVQEYGQSSVMLRFRVQLRTSLTETRQRLLLKTDVMR